MLLELLEVAVNIRIVEIVIEDDDRKINVRIVLITIGVVLANTGREPEFVGIGRERVPVEKTDIRRLLSRFNRCSTSCSAD
jgi:hypothetical protein